MRLTVPQLLLPSTLLLSLTLGGCGNGIAGGGTGTTPFSGATLQGRVQGGQQPVSGSTITLWAVGTTGYGSTATAISNSGIVTDANGNFTLTGKFTCPSANTLVYLTSTGGNPGLTAGTNNTALSMMTALGNCGSLTSSTFIFVDEVSTVASVYALAQFMNVSTQSVGSYSYATLGLTNAFTVAQNLYNSATGQALAQTPAGNGAVPASELNTLADALSSCINTASGSSSGCTALFSATTANSVTPTNTLQAALQIALNPGNQVSAIYGLVPSTPPFTPTLTGSPHDWTVALSFNYGHTSPTALAVDSSGQLWVLDYVASAGTVNILTPNGTVSTSNASGLSGPRGIAFDQTGSAWIVNYDGGGITGYNSSGNSFVGPITSGLSSPSGVAVDSNNNIWVSNGASNTLAEFSSSGSNLSLLSGSGYTGGLSTPRSVAIDQLGNVWVANVGSVSGFTSSGTALSGSPSSVAGTASTPAGLTINAQNTVWATAPGGGGTTLTSLVLNSGNISTSGYAPSNSGAASAIAVDGANKQWMLLSSPGGLLPVSSSGSASSSLAYQSSTLNSPNSIAIDGSGNIWVGNKNTTTTGSLTTSLTEFVGLASPVITPTSQALAQSQLGTTPGTTIPLSITSGVLPAFANTVSYAVQLYASGGNSGSLTWSIASGSLPNGLSLSPGGLISGTPTSAVASTVSVQVQDAGNTSNTASKSFTIPNSSGLSARGNESALNNTYTFLLNTFKNNSSAGSINGAALIGTITFNGTGSVSGEVDYVGSSDPPVNTTYTGTYNFGSDGRGLLVLVPNGAGVILEYALSGGSYVASTPRQIYMQEFDDTNANTTGNSGNLGAGIAKLQTASAITSSTLAQAFVYGIQGQTPCSTCNGTVTPYGLLSAVGRFAGNGSGSLTGQQDAAAVATSYNGITLSGTYTNPDSFGRGTLTVGYTGTTYPAAPTHFVYYIVNSGELLLSSIDNHASMSLLSGDALVQSSSPSTASFTGPAIIYGSYSDSGGSSASLPTTSDVFVARASVPSSGTLNLLEDQNNAGGLKVEKTQGPLNFSIDTNGRMTFSSGGVPIFYYSTSGVLFGTEQPSGNNDQPGLLTIEPQTGSNFSCSDLNGTYGFGTQLMPLTVGVSTGTITGSSGTLTATVDQINNYSIQQGSVQTYTCAADSYTNVNGRVVVSGNGDNVVVYPINQGSRYVFFTQHGTTSAVRIIQK